MSTTTITNTAAGCEDEALAVLWAALGGDASLTAAVRRRGRADALPAAYDAGTLAVVVVAAATLAAAELLAARAAGTVPAVVVDRVHAAAAFRSEALFAALVDDSAGVGSSRRRLPRRRRLGAPAHQLRPPPRRRPRRAHRRPGRQPGRARRRSGRVARRCPWRRPWWLPAGVPPPCAPNASWADHPQGRAVAAEPLRQRGVHRGHRRRAGWAAGAPGGHPSPACGSST